MVAVRAFIAVEIPPELQKQLAQVQDRLRRELRDLPIRWVQTGKHSPHLKIPRDDSRLPYR